MSDKIIEMLKDSINVGYTPADIKEAIINTLSEYFDNKTALSKYSTTSEILSIFEFIIRYHYDTLFFSGLKEVLECYRAAYKISSDNTLKIILSTIKDFSQKENLMWTVRQHTPTNLSSDIYDNVIVYMKHIGDNLEIGTKHIIFEIYALIRLINGKQVNYEQIQKCDFGVVIKNILDQNLFENILKTSPISIKLSDWRNIAYHHTYSIEEGKIVCIYGKQNISFEITFDELQNYVHQIVRASNIFNIARCIFVFDNLDNINSLSLHAGEKIDFRKPLLINQLKISLLSQGFLLIKYFENKTSISISLNDLRNNGTLSESEKRKRKIHSSQFLYNAWCVFQKEFLSVIYCDKDGNEQFASSVSGEICNTIFEGKENLSYLAHYVELKDL